MATRRTIRKMKIMRICDPLRLGLTPIYSKFINPSVFMVKKPKAVFTALFWLPPLRNGVTPLAPFSSGANLPSTVYRRNRFLVVLSCYLGLFAVTSAELIFFRDYR
jgi:hypothetical protein